MRVNSKFLIQALGLCGVLALPAVPAHALEAGDWLVRVGGSYVAPNDNSGIVTGLGAGTGVGVNGAGSLSFTVGRMVTSNLGVELLAAWPFTHDITGAGTLSGLGKIAEVKQLPPTLSLQYYFMPKAAVRPYAGLGLNYTTFFSGKTKGALTGNSISLDDSWGLAAQAGVDFDIGSNWFVNADVRYISISTTATISGGVGTVDVDINPWVYSVGVGTRF